MDHGPALVPQRKQYTVDSLEGMIMPFMSFWTLNFEHP